MSKQHLLWLQNYLEETYKTPILESFLNLQIIEISDGKFISLMNNSNYLSKLKLLTL